MLPYWFMFLLPSVGAMLGLGQHRQGRRRDQAFLIVLFLIFIMLIGLRDHTGGDFDNYQRTVNYMVFESFATSLQHGDPAFTVIARTSNVFGFGVYGVNFVCGALFMYGLLRFVRLLPDPWLAIAAAVPYMVIVIAMGYIRQGVAIGFILLAVMDLDRKSYGWLAAHLLGAILFHVTSVLIVPVLAVAVLRNRPGALMLLALAGVAAYPLVLRDRVTGLYNGYVATEYDSSGALVRLLMNALPAIIFLRFRERFPISPTVKAFWVLVSILTLALLPLLVVSTSSTWIDRIGLFFAPIQLVVFGYLTTIFATDAREQRIAAFLAVLFYGTVLFVWLNYAANSASWLPYRWLLSDTAFS